MKARIVAVHTELSSTVTSVLQFVNINPGDKTVRAVRAMRSTEDRWIREAIERAQNEAIAAGLGLRISNHTLRYS